jgi:uncharacterized delta-60 repeat protein/uncharacterized repeat protein (TIGR01451 family)
MWTGFFRKMGGDDEVGNAAGDFDALFVAGDLTRHVGASMIRHSLAGHLAGVGSEFRQIIAVWPSRCYAFVAHVVKFSFMQERRKFGHRGGIEMLWRWFKRAAQSSVSRNWYVDARRRARLSGWERLEDRTVPSLVVVNEGTQAVNSGALSDFIGLGPQIVSVAATVGNAGFDSLSGTWSWSFDTSDGPDQSQTVNLTATDSDGGQSSISFDLVVNNVAPTVSVTGDAIVTVNEGTQATNSGTFADVGADVVTVTVSIGTINQTGTQNGTWSWSFSASNGPAQTQTVTITATDSDGGQSATSFDLVVNNIAPTLSVTVGLAQGTLDPNFGGGDGIAILPTAGSSQINALENLPAGKILGGGSLGADFALFRMNADGSLDSTFNGDGIATADFGAASNIQGLAMTPGGKIVAAGRCASTAALARFNSDGTLDTSFDGDGRLLVNLGPGDETLFDVVVQPDGKIVAAGTLQLAAGSNDHDFVVARFNVDGSLDTSFGGGDGIVTADFGPADNAATTVLLQTDGKIIALGHAAFGFDDSGFAIARFTAAGALDAGFGNGGLFLLDAGADYAFEDIRGAALRPDGKIVAVGQVWHHVAGPENDIVLLQLLPNGTLDNSFGDGGTVFSVFETNWNEANAMSLAADGSIVVGGDAPDGINAHILRYNEDGALDPTFGITSPGRTVVDISPVDNMFAVAIQPNGDILLGGATSGQAVVLRFLGNASRVVDEGSQTTVAGVFADPGADVVTVTASIGAITQTGTQIGTWSWSFDATDGPNQSQTVTITATDSDGAQSTETFNLIVRDVAPSIALGGNSQVNKLAPYLLNLGAITDPGADTVTGYAIRWGDGQSSGVIPIANFAAQAQHVFATPGAYVMHVDLYDEDGTHADAGLWNVQVRNAAPNLKVTQTRTPVAVARGGTVVFRITIANLGNWLASGVVVNFQLPVGLNRLVAGSTPGWTPDGVRHFHINLGKLAAGGRVTLAFKVRVAGTARPGSILTATAAAILDALNGPDANPADNVNRTMVRVL